MLLPFKKKRGGEVINAGTSDFLAWSRQGGLLFFCSRFCWNFVYCVALKNQPSGQIFLCGILHIVALVRGKKKRRGVTSYSVVSISYLARA